MRKIIVIACAVVCLTSCSVNINLTAQQARAIEEKKFSRFKLSPQESITLTLTSFGSVAAGKQFVKDKNQQQ